MKMRGLFNRGCAARRSGQAIIFVLMVLVILTFVALWQFDIHKTLFVKYKSRNGGDSAALAAARWQALALNMIGEMNILQAVSISQSLTVGDNTFADARQIGDLEARIGFTGPMIGFLASQQAAKNNGMYVNDDFTQAVLDHAEEIRNEYPIRYPDPPYVNGSGGSAWEDYADMVAQVASYGIAAWPDNVRYYTDYMSAEHMLLNPSFYDAVASKNWCWFFFNAYDLLRSYSSYRDWPPLPVYSEPRPASAEYFSLNTRRVSRLSSFGTITFTNQPFDADDLVQYIGQLASPPQMLHTGVVDVAANWLFYRDETWGSWQNFVGDDFPFRGTIKTEYDYVGADAAVRTISNVDRVSPGINAADVTWSAAAKPFGALEGPVKPSTYGIVLPAFTDVRLIPVDTSTALAGGSRPNWGIHIHEHLPDYVALGPAQLRGGCWYCTQIRTWEIPEFRAEGVEWLVYNSAQCYIRPIGGGGGGGGGSRRGH